MTEANKPEGERMDYLQLYNLERYLFDDVRSSFQKYSKLSAFDFFCIIIWKANRAKSKVALKLVAHGEGATNDLNTLVERLTFSIAKAQDDKTRMRVLIEGWSFRLPMATAVLTVLYPESFTVYDVRVCDELLNHHNVQNKTRFDDLWAGYQAYLADVRNREPTVSALRDKDRTLWAKSFEKQLNDDISTLFQKDDA
jgi:hypothetical protein